MEQVAPAGPVYQAGTLAGNPVTMAAGIATLRQLAAPGVWDAVSAATERLAFGITTTGAEAGVPLRVHRVGTMLTAFFTDDPVTDWTTADRCDRDRFARIFRRLLEAGVYWVPSQFEAAFLSTAHGDRELVHTIEAFREALRGEQRSDA
jgi:glutamate-1-semialdehyde 2,1-aminomutase